MTEKINGQGFRPATDTSSTGDTRRPDYSGTAAGTRGAARSGGAPAADTVRLTDSSLLLNRLEEALRGAPAVDADRVEAVKQAIDSGVYEIEPRTVAEKIVTIEQALRG